jgi:hypothetical protein
MTTTIGLAMKVKRAMKVTRGCEIKDGDENKGGNWQRIQNPDVFDRNVAFYSLFRPAYRGPRDFPRRKQSPTSGGN